jgi:VCBS repeat-containing protein
VLDAPPDCHADFHDYRTAEDVALTSLLVCNDDDGDVLSYAVATPPAHGAVSINADGSFKYTPALDDNGPDTFDFTASDGQSSDVGTATVDVTPVNDSPVATPDAKSMAEDSGSVVTPNVLENDTPGGGPDEADQKLTVTAFTQPSHGKVADNSDGTFTYTPAADFNGTDSFTYDVTDDGLTDGEPDPKTSTGTVTITVTPVNDAPVAADDAYAAHENIAVSVSAANGVLNNDSDVDVDPLIAVLVSGPAHGTLALNANGSFTYTPEAGFTGADSFTYKATDGRLASNVATVSLSVTDDAPVAHNDGSYAVTGNTPLTVGAPGVLANDTDLDGDALTAKKATNPGHGSVTVNASGSFTYTPQHDYVGSDSFAYFANDGTIDSASPAIVTLNVSAPPTFALTVIRSGTGTGIVTSNPVGINCGADCTETYSKDTQVTLTAAPASNAAFAGWTGGCTGTALTCIVAMDGVKSVTAVFVKQHWDAKVTKAGGGDGVVASVPAGINCGPTCGSSYEDGAVVTLTATPNSSSEFDKWSGACSGSSNVCTVTISGSTSVIANFKAKKTPPPKVGETVVGGPVSGNVTYKLPGSKAFVPLTGPVQFPNGTIVNAKNGVVSIASAEGNGTIAHADVWAGIFQIHTYVYKPLTLFGPEAKKKLYGTQFKLVEKLDCTSAGLQRTRKRKLLGSGKGKFRTKGRYSSATVRATKWYVEDRCDGTLTKVAKGIVEVQDFVRHKVALVKAGHQYFASAKASEKASKKAKRR